MDGAGGVDGLYVVALGANEVVSMDIGQEKCEVSSTFVQAEAAHHSSIIESF